MGSEKLVKSNASGVSAEHKDRSASSEPLNRQIFGAEFIGTTVLIIIGTCAVANAQVQEDVKLDDHVSDQFGRSGFVNMCWGLAVTFGVLVSFDVSGAHLNPAVTLSNIVFSGLPIKKGLVYMAAQMAGAMFGALLTAINFVAFKGKNNLGNYFSTAAAKGVSMENAFFQEFLATALLIGCINAVCSSDKPPTKFRVGGFVGALVFAIGQCMGVQTGYAINPARDLGPRLVYAFLRVCYGLEAVNECFGDGFWLIPIFAPFIGGLVGALIFKQSQKLVAVKRPNLYDDETAVVELANA